MTSPAILATLRSYEPKQYPQLTPHLFQGVNQLLYSDKPTLHLDEKQRILAPKEAVTLYTKLLGRNKMQWKCDETGDTISASILEPMNKPVYCNSCGKTHLLTPGKMDDEDLRIIERIKEAGVEDDDTLYLCDAVTARVSETTILRTSRTGMERYQRFGGRHGDSVYDA